MWKAIGTDIKDGEEIESDSYKYVINRCINPGASYTYEATRDDSKKIFLKQFREPTQFQKGVDWDGFIKQQHSIFRILQQIPDAVEKNYEAFEFKGYHFQAKAYSESSNLLDTIWSNITFQQRFNLVLLLLSTLDKVHKKGIVHSDLKPEQFLVKEDKTTEFGWQTRLIDFDHCIIPKLDIYNPAETPGWQSPEHVKKEKIDFHSDVFTMGQITYTVLAKKQPYKDAIENDTYDKDILSKKGYISLYELYNQKFPKDISDIIDDMLDPDPKKRPSIEEVYSIIGKTLNTKLKPEIIYLESNGKKRVIIKTEVITRDKVKQTFGNHKEIYTKQFEIFKDKNGDWFIKGYDVPSSAKDKKGNSYTFYKTICNGEDITNKYVSLENEAKITVGKTEFTIRF